MFTINSMNACKSFIVFLLIQCIALLGIFWPYALNGDLLVIGDFSGSDLLDMHLPYKFILHDALQSGTLPFWTDSLGNGMPFLAEGQAGVLYPVNFILGFFEPVDALMLSMICAVVIAGMGMYCYLYFSLRLGFFASTLGALAFSFSSVLLFRIKHLNYVHAISLLPFIVWLYSWWLYRGYIKYLFLTVFFLTMVVYTGAPPFLYYYGFFIFIYTLLYFIVAHINKEPYSFRRIVGGLCSIYLLTILFGAPQLLPTLEYIQFTSRGIEGNNYLSNTAYPFNPLFYATMINPYLLGNPASGTYTLSISHFGVWWENVFYFGSSGAILVCLFFVKQFISLIRSRDFIKILRLPQEILAYVFVLIFFGYLSLGSFSVLHLFLHTVLPGFSYFRFPQRFHVFVIFSLCIFFGYIVQRLAWKRFLLVGMIVVLIAEFAVVYAQYFSFIPRKEYLSHSIPRVITETDERIYSLSQYYFNPYLYGWKGNENEIANMQYSIPGDNAARFGLDSFSNRNWFEGGLVLRQRFDFENDLLMNYSDSCELFQDSLQKWSVRYVVDVENREGLYGTVPDAGCFTAVDSKDDYVWYQLEATYPRVYLTQNYNDPPVLIDHTVDITLRGNEQHEKSYTLSSKDGGYLVVTDYNYAGWRVYVNGIRTESLTNSIGQKVVKLSGGNAEIVWRYVPVSFYVGIALFFLGFVVSLLLLRFEKILFASINS